MWIPIGGPSPELDTLQAETSGVRIRVVGLGSSRRNGESVTVDDLSAQAVTANRGPTPVTLTGTEDRPETGRSRFVVRPGDIGPTLDRIEGWYQPPTG